MLFVNIYIGIKMKVCILNILFFFFMGVALSGCMGTHFSDDDLLKVKVGVDTEDTIKKTFGQPWETRYSFDTSDLKLKLYNSGINIDPKNYVHRFGIYTFSISTLLTKKTAYFELTIFVYEPKTNIMKDVKEYNCLTQVTCEDIIKDLQEVYASTDYQDIDKAVDSEISRLSKQKQAELKKQKEQMAKDSAVRKEKQKQAQQRLNKVEQETKKTKSNNVQVERNVTLDTELTPTTGNDKPIVRRNIGI